MQQQRLVSIVMPAYNAGRYVAESVRSVRAQTCGRWELFVVDDGSTDETRAVVEGFAAEDARVSYVGRENGGQAAARNTGLRAARGDLVAFLDADDLWLPGKLEAQLGVLEERGVDLVYSDGYIFSEEGGEWADERFHVLPGEARGAEMFRTLFERIASPRSPCWCGATRSTRSGSSTKIALTRTARTTTSG